MSVSIHAQLSSYRIANSSQVAMADAMIREIVAGAAEGGDKRCVGTGSATAFISLFRKSDNERVPWLNLVAYGIEPGSLDVVTQLQALYGDWRQSQPTPISLQILKIPTTAKSIGKSGADDR